MNKLVFISAIPILFASLLWYVVALPWYCSGLCCFRSASCVEPSLTGYHDPKYESVVKAFQQSLAQGWDLGASLFVSMDGGETAAIDVAGGYKDKQKTEVYDSSTVNAIFSSGKVIETIGMAILVDKGLIELDAPIAEYWPEFNQKGKGEITIKDLLSHRSGSSTLFEVEPSVEVLKAPEKRDEFLASQKFPYPRGTVGYRAWGSAFYSDAICRRVDPQKRTLSKLVQDEIFDPLGEVFLCPLVPEEAKASIFSEVHDIPLSTILLGFLPQLYFPGIYSRALGENHRIVMNPIADAPVFKASVLSQTDTQPNPFQLPSIPDAKEGAASYNNHSSFLAYEMMSGNCISNARAIGKALDAFMNGKVVGEETFNAFMTKFPKARDQLLHLQVTHTAGGFATTPTDVFPELDDTECSGWLGLGGSLLVHCSVKEQSAFTFAYVMNGMSPRLEPDRGFRLVKELVAIILS
jgi:CubicO group peptidase (beta-lactamase class C family)